MLDLTLAQEKFAFDCMINRLIDFAPFSIVYTKVPNIVVDLHEFPSRVTHCSTKNLVELLQICTGKFMKAWMLAINSIKLLLIKVAG